MKEYTSQVKCGQVWISLEQFRRKYLNLWTSHGHEMLNPPCDHSKDMTQQQTHQNWEARQAEQESEKQKLWSCCRDPQLTWDNLSTGQLLAAHPTKAQSHRKSYIFQALWRIDPAAFVSSSTRWPLFLIVNYGMFAVTHCALLWFELSRKISWASSCERLLNTQKAQKCVRILLCKNCTWLRMFRIYSLNTSRRTDMCLSWQDVFSQRTGSERIIIQ